MSLAKNIELPELNNFLPDPYDLACLKIISPNTVEQCVENLNALPPTVSGQKKILVGIGTGGTISMREKSNIRVPDLDFCDILMHASPYLHAHYEVVALDAFRIDSSQMHYGHIHDLCIAMCYIWKHTKVPFTGFLIPHGTDTMAYSAAATSLIMGQGLPFSIVFTGAQKSILEEMNDAANNLRNALFTLEALHTHDMAEVLVVMGDYAMLGTSALKVEDTLENAFDTPLHDYVAKFSTLDYPIKPANWLKPKRDKVPFNPAIWDNTYSHTLVIHSMLGLCPEMAERQVNDDQVKAVLLYSYGSGAIHKDISQSIMKEARAKNCPVFILSPLNTEYKIIYESSANIIRDGAIPLYMTLPSALTKIEIALNLYPNDKDAISNFMTTNYVGEIPVQAKQA